MNVDKFQNEFNKEFIGLLFTLFNEASIQKSGKELIDTERFKDIELGKFNELEQYVQKAFEIFNVKIENEDQLANFYKFREMSLILFNGFDPFIEKLTKFGWYYDEDFNFLDISLLKKLLDSEDISGLDAFFNEYYFARTPNILSDIINIYPDTKSICDQIIAGYESKLYYLVVPAIIILIENIAHQTFGKYFFKNDVIDSMIDKLDSLLSMAIKSSTPFTASTREENEFPILFNRHRVVHGKDMTYGNQTNTNKAISYLSHFLMLSEEYKKQVDE